MTDWITDFVDATAKVNSPQLFRKWGAISALSSAMERKLFVITKQSQLFANMYIIFVAPPGVGKTEITYRIRDMIEDIPDHHVSPSSLTKAALVDALQDAARVVPMPLPDEPLRYNALPIVSGELGVLLPAYDYEFMNFLTDLYDSKSYTEHRRTKNIKIEVKKPLLTILAACTPAYLKTMLPEGAWDQGFLSRTMLIFNSEIELGELFGDDAFDEQDPLAPMKERLKKKALLKGKMEFTDAAKTIINDWYKRRGDPAPEHPKLMHYNTRRIVHLLKLCMIVSVSEGDDLIINDGHVLRALDYLVEAEFHMPQIFKAMSSGGASEVIKEAWHFLYTTYNKTGKKPISEFRLVNFLSSKVPPYQVPQIIELMTKGKLIKETLEKDGKGFVPVTKE